MSKIQDLNKIEVDTGAKQVLGETLFRIRCPNNVITDSYEFFNID